MTAEEVIAGRELWRIVAQALRPDRGTTTICLGECTVGWHRYWDTLFGDEPHLLLSAVMHISQTAVRCIAQTTGVGPLNCSGGGDNDLNADDDDFGTTVGSAGVRICIAELVPTKLPAENSAAALTAQ